MVGMYRLNPEDVQKVRQSMKRKETLKFVRSDSIMALRENPCEKKQREIAEKLFHNSEVLAAKGAHAPQKAKIKLQHSNSTLESATEVALGFKKAVDEMNK